MEEIWKDIKGYEGKYQVSNLGRIKSLKRFVMTGANYQTPRTFEEKILKQSLNKKGYCIISLWSKNGIKNHIVHREVAKAFVPNPYNLTQINHIDENKQNNVADNLEWCTIEYNNNYGTRNKRHSKTLSKKIVQLDLDGNFIKEWNSATEVQKELGYDASSIRKCCCNKTKTAYKYLWKEKVC